MIDRRGGRMLEVLALSAGGAKWHISLLGNCRGAWVAARSLGREGIRMNEKLQAVLGWALQEKVAQAPPAFPPELIFALGIIALLFFILVLKPQRAEQRKREEMISELGKGDQVVTIGGIHGTVESVDKEKGTVMLNIAPKLPV